MSRVPFMSSGPVAIVDSINSLLEAETNSLFRFMDEGSPYLGRATAEMRKPLLDMVATGERHMAELAELIETLGGTPSPRHVQPEEQYLAYLSIKFLLPKLMADKELMIERYENAKASLAGAPAEVLDLLERHLRTHRAHVKTLQQAAAHAIGK
jgi:hypothetical protein